MVFVFSTALFVSAVLLFSVQLMFAKMVLPLLGGTPAVWNTCMVFFQAVLLAGYSYAHLATSRLGIHRQLLVHVVLLLLPFLTLPIGIPVSWTPPTEAHPVPWLLQLLLLRVGLAFFVVSTSAPLLQRWFTATPHPAAHDPYFLYAASNLGSLLALLSYPVLVEPTLRLAAQSWLWSAGYSVLVILTVSCAWLVRRSQEAAAPSSAQGQGSLYSASAASEPPEANSDLTVSRRLRWVMLSFVPSSLLLGVTTYLSTDIAAIPLLWVVPLAIYLLTFVFVFSRRPPLSHELMVRALPILVLPLAISMVAYKTGPAQLLIPLHVLTLFVAAMVCHGELAKDRPPTRYLTEFYLWLSVGGCAGGLFNAVVAPLVFDTVLEYPLALVLACFLRPGVETKGQSSQSPWLDYALPLAFGLMVTGLALAVQAIGVEPEPLRTGLVSGLPAFICFALFRYRPIRFGLGVGAFLFVGIFVTTGWERTLHVERSFFGVYRVMRGWSEGGQHQYHELSHGTTLHGMQSLDRGRSREPLTYYHPTGPLGQIFELFAAQPQRLRRVGMIGLGTGSTACYASPAQQWTFYEIDPTVLTLAINPRYFTFLRDCLEAAEVVLGDARLSLMLAPDHHYDLLIVDAFSSDAIPIHLITQEAVHVYLSKLADGGVIAFHISNRHLDLQPVVAGLAQAEGLVGRVRANLTISEEELALGKTASVWAVLARRLEDLGVLADHAQWHHLVPPPGMAVWRDDFSNLLSVFQWK